MREALINGRWPLKLPDHRADFHDAHPWWEAARLADMWYRLQPRCPHEGPYYCCGIQIGETCQCCEDKRTHRLTIIDIGSEEGDLTALYASWGANVPHIDPSMPWITQTLETFAANGLTPQPAFVGLADNYNYIEGKPVGEKRFVTMDEKVARITLDTFVDWNDLQVDAVSMDVEGAELRVLEGAHMLLTENVVWWISIHGEVDPSSYVPSKVHEFMRDRGFKDQFLAFDHEWHYRFWRP